MGKLIMVRHGESEGNAIRRFTTTGDAKITELGRRQAHEAALRIKLKVSADAGDCEHVRARPRDRPHHRRRNCACPIEYEAEFREQSLGDLAGQPYESVAQRSHLRSETPMGVARAGWRES